MTLNSAALGEKGKVTVIIPTFNRGHLIQRAIKSVLEQTYKNLELIVVDDCSTDDTEFKVKEVIDNRLSYIRNEKNSGPSASRNKGIEISKGEYIAFLDSDDRWLPAKLEKQLKVIQTDDEAGAVHCGIEFLDFNTGEKIRESLMDADFRKNFTTGSYFLSPANVTFFIKKEVLDDVGYFDERLFAHEDTELTIRISKKYKILTADEILVSVTRNHDQLMTNAFNYTKAAEIIYEKHKDFLSKKILLNLCKQIANYYIITEDFSYAKKFVRYSLKYKPSNIKSALRFIQTMLQLSLLSIAPFILKILYRQKYKGEIPLTSGLEKN